MSAHPGRANPDPLAPFVPMQPPTRQQQQQQQHQHQQQAPPEARASEGPTPPFPSPHDPLSTAQPHVQARVAVVLYDMLLRGANVEPLSSNLSRTFPMAANLARQYAQYARQALLVTTHARAAPGVQEGTPNARELILGKVNVTNVAWFCFFVALLHGIVRLFVVFVFFVVAMVFNSAETPATSNILSKLFTYTVNEGPYTEFFKWLTRVFAHDPITAEGTTETWKAAARLNDFLAASLLLTPLFQGLMAFLAGATLSMLINSALSIIGGIRFHDGVPHDD